MLVSCKTYLLTDTNVVQTHISDWYCFHRCGLLTYICSLHSIISDWYQIYTDLSYWLGIVIYKLWFVTDTDFMQTPLNDWHVADSIALWWEMETVSIALCIFQSHGVAPCSWFFFMWYFFIFYRACMHAVTINSLNMYLIFLSFDHELNYIWNIPVLCEVYKGVSPHKLSLRLFLCICFLVGCQYLLHYSHCSYSPSCFIAAQLSFLLFLGHLIGPFP
jgi:hypothetical protein